jgi:hypothetical protein
MRKLLFNFFSIHILKLEISGCDIQPSTTRKRYTTTIYDNQHGQRNTNIRKQRTTGNTYTRTKEYIKSVCTSRTDSHQGTNGRRATRTCKMMPPRMKMTPTPPSSFCPQRSRPSFHLARQMDRRRNNTSNKVRYISKTNPLSARKNWNILKRS